MLGVDAPCEDSGGGVVGSRAQQRRQRGLQALCDEVHTRCIGVQAIWKQALQGAQHCEAGQPCWKQSCWA